MRTPLLEVFRLFSAALIVVAVVSSCTNNVENPGTTEPTAQALKTAVRSITSPNTTTTNQNDLDHSSDYLDEFDCFDLVFPVDVTDGTTTTTINNYEELWTYYESLPDTIEPDFIYPISIQYEDGTTVTLNNLEEVENAFDECYDEVDDCFTLNFPVSLTDESGNTVTVNSEEELSDFWDANETDTFEPSFVYPISVTLTANGSTLTINNDEGFDDLYEECYDFEDCDFEDFDCFVLQFPIEASSTNGGNITVNNEDELYDYFETLGDDEDPNFTFPLTIVYEDGSTLQINSLEELEEAFDECYDEEYEVEDCFTFNYPLTVIKEDGSNVTINTDDEFETFLDDIGDEGFSFQYPFSVTQDGETVTVNNEGALFLLFDNCL